VRSFFEVILRSTKHTIVYPSSGPSLDVIVSEIDELLYPYLSLQTLSPSSYMFCSCFVLSFDACIVTITWSLLFVVIALWVICLTR
jgi:hypothetical protein